MKIVWAENVSKRSWFASKLWLCLQISAVCLITFLAYQKALSGYFLGDDLDFLYYTAAWSRQGELLSRLLGEFVVPQDRGGFFYRPILMMSYGADYLLWGTNPIGWHVTNLMLHIVNALLVWGLISHLIGRRHDRISGVVAAVAALVFAVRPSFPETVAWISGRPDELALFGILVSFLFYLRSNGEWGKAYCLSLAAFLFALGSKEVGVTLPGGLAAMHIAGAIATTPNPGESSRKAWIRQVARGIGPFLVFLAAYFTWRFVLFGTAFKVYQNAASVALADPTWWTAKLQALRFFLVQSLSFNTTAQVFLIVTLSQMVLGFAVGWRVALARRVWLFGACWLLAELLPAIQQLSLSPQGEGARLFYIPGAALAVLLVVPLTTTPGKPLERYLWSAGVVFAILIVLLSLPLHRQLLRPWLLAGASMKALPRSVAAIAEQAPEKGLAILLIPDHVQGALFGRNGQGTLMEPPLQRRPLGDRALVVTPPTLRDHAPRLVASARQGAKLEGWSWSVSSRRFERIALNPCTNTDEWLEEWRSGLRSQGFPELAEELARL